MSSALSKIQFHLALYKTFLVGRRDRFQEVSKKPLDDTESFPKNLKVFFWTPSKTPGASVIVHDMLPELIRLVLEVAPTWKIQVGERLPEHPVDWLICFKAVPEADKVIGHPRKVLLICDQAEVYWNHLRKFVVIVTTSSRPFSNLLSTCHPRVSFISESEPLDNLAFGKINLATSPAARGNVLLWHGGDYSQDALNQLRPMLTDWAKTTDVKLHIVGGKGEPRQEIWGTIAVHFFPWSKEQLQRSAAVARLGFVPARFSLKNSWLKPASRVRCLYALGVPAIGDDRVPDAVDFMASFNGPLAGRSRDWRSALAELWNDSDSLGRLAAAGHAAVSENFSTEQTARQWLRYLSNTPIP